MYVNCSLCRIIAIGINPRFQELTIIIRITGIRIWFGLGGDNNDPHK